MGTEPVEDPAFDEQVYRLVDVCQTIHQSLARGGVQVAPELIASAIYEAHIPELLAPQPRETAAPRRYSVRANPEIADGKTETLSFRVPRAVKALFDERVAELAADENEPGIENQTDAGQDAIVKWCLMEGK